MTFKSSDFALIGAGFGLGLMAGFPIGYHMCKKYINEMVHEQVHSILNESEASTVSDSIDPKTDGTEEIDVKVPDEDPPKMEPGAIDALERYRGVKPTVEPDIKPIRPDEFGTAGYEEEYIEIYSDPIYLNFNEIELSIEEMKELCGVDFMNVLDEMHPDCAYFRNHKKKKDIEVSRINRLYQEC